MNAQSPEPDAMQAIVAHFNQGRYSDAERLQDLTARYPLHGFGWKLLSHVLQLLGRHAEAFSATQKGVELIPDDAELHINLGKALQDQRRLVGFTRLTQRRADDNSGTFREAST